MMTDVLKPQPRKETVILSYEFAVVGKLAFCEAWIGESGNREDAISRRNRNSIEATGPRALRESLSDCLVTAHAWDYQTVVMRCKAGDDWITRYQGPISPLLNHINQWLRGCDQHVSVPEGIDDARIHWG